MMDDAQENVKQKMEIEIKNVHIRIEDSQSQQSFSTADANRVNLTTV
eukprot:COSAG02_NODE_715_length_18086_cov_109.753433_12_plen_47_part_00